MHRMPCPSCGHRLKYADEHQGKKARCQKCGHSFRLPVAVAEPELFDEEPEATHDEREYDREEIAEPGRKMRPWLAVGVLAFISLGVGLGVWAVTTSGENPKPAPSAPEPSPPSVVEPVRYDGEWTGPSATGHRVDGLIIDRNEFPCTGTVRIGSANVILSVPVLWTRDKDELIGTDHRGSPDAAGPVLARVRLAKGLLSGEAKAPDDALFISTEMKAFAGFKRTGPPPTPASTSPALPKKPQTSLKPPPTPAELIVGKWSGKYPIKKIAGNIEVLDEVWEFEKSGTLRRVITIPGGTISQEGTYRVADGKSLELDTSGTGKKLVWKMTLTPDSLVIAHPTEPEPGAVGAGTSTLQRAKESPKAVVAKPKVEEKPLVSVEGKPDIALSDRINKQLEKSKRRIHPFYAKAATGGKLDVEKGKDVAWNDGVASWHSAIGWAWSSTFAGLPDGTVFVNIGPHPVTASGVVVAKGECVVLRKGRLAKVDLAELEAEEK